MRVRITRVVAKEVESTDKECAVSGGARCSLGRGVPRVAVSLEKKVVTHQWN